MDRLGRSVWLSVCLFGLVLWSGCPEPPLPPLGVAITASVAPGGDGVITVDEGALIRFTAAASGGAGDYRYQWAVSSETQPQGLGPYHDLARGDSFDRTFTEAGWFRLRVLVTDPTGESADEITVQVKAVPVRIIPPIVVPPPVVIIPPPEISFDFTKIFIVNGSFVDGKIPVEIGVELILDCSGAIAGGQPPLEIVWCDENGLVIGRGPRLVWRPTAVGEQKIVIKITDRRSGPPLQITIIIVVKPKPVPPPPPPPPDPTVDLKANNSDGPLTVVAGYNNRAMVKASWGSSDALRLIASGAPDWTGELSKLNGVDDNVVLALGIWTLKVRAIGAAGTTPAEDTVVVEVKTKPVPPKPPKPKVTITQPNDGASFVRTGNPKKVTVMLRVEVEDGVPPFSFSVKFPDEHLQRDNFDGRVWEFPKTFSIPGSGWIAAEVTDSRGLVSNRDQIMITVH